MIDADLLRRAALLVEEVAKGTTEGPWSGYVNAEDGIAHIYAGPEQNGYLTGSVLYWPEEVTEEYADHPRAEDIAWIGLMNPLVARPLAAWLRAAAAQIAILCRDVVDPSEPGIVQHIEYVHEHPLALARAILGEQP